MTSANATDGHPLLKSYCEEVARRSKFRILRIDGQAVKTTGEMVYRFDIKKAGWARIGASLTSLEMASTLRYFAVPAIMKAFAPEWADEREMLGQIAQMKEDELKKYPDEMDDRPMLRRTMVQTANGSSITAVIGRRLPVPNPAAPELAAISQRLIISIRARLAKDELALWQFDLGIALNSALMRNRNSNAPKEAVDIITGLIGSAPKDVLPSTLSDLKTLAAVIEGVPRSNNGFRELPRLMIAIINSN